MPKLNLRPGLLNPIAFKHLIDAVGAPTMVIEVRDADKLHYAILNPAAERYFGVKNENYAGKEIEEYKGTDELRGQRRKKTIDAYRECIQSGQTILLEVEHIHPELGTRWGRHTIAPLIDSGRDTVRQMMVTSIDVTDLLSVQKRLDEALTRTLSEFVTICAACKDIKSEQAWVSIEEYASKELDYRSFSHGLCPECMRHHLDT